MRFFILEDDPERIKWFKLNLHPTIDLDVTDDVDIAIKKLNEVEYDLIFLDHDLGGMQMVSSAERNTGYTIAKMIHLTENKKLNVIVHSWNGTGAKNMIDVMKSNGINCQYLFFRGKEFISAIRQANEQI